MEERSLRKILSKGTAVRSPPKEVSFQTRLNSQYRFDGDPTIGRVLPISQPRLEMAVAASLLSEEGT